MIRKSTKELLADSFRELAEKQSINKITVQDIAANCGYSVATFYRYFQNKNDLISWSYMNSLKEAMKGIHPSENSWRMFIQDGLKTCFDRKKIIRNLIQNTRGYDSFVNTMITINVDVIKKYILICSREDEIEEEIALCIRGYCGGMVLLLCEWILNRLSLTKEEMANLYIICMPELLKNKIGMMK